MPFLFCEYIIYCYIQVIQFFQWWNLVCIHYNQNNMYFLHLLKHTICLNIYVYRNLGKKQGRGDNKELSSSRFSRLYGYSTSNSGQKYQQTTRIHMSVSKQYFDQHKFQKTWFSIYSCLQYGCLIHPFQINANKKKLSYHTLPTNHTLQVGWPTVCINGKMIIFKM